MAKDQTWQERKDHLKRQFGLWAIRREDITASLNAWLAFRKEQGAQPSDHFATLTAFVAFVADYGRVFSGDMALKGNSPWIPAEDAELHRMLMDLRDEAVAHSDWRFRSVTLIPPGATVSGLPTVPSHHLEGWRWLVRAGELQVAVAHVERRLRRLQQLFEQRVEEAFQRLMEHCKDQLLLATETPLDEF